MGFIHLAIQAGLRLAANQAIKDFGEISHLEVDREDRRITATILLHGEQTAVDVHVGRFEILERNDRTFIQFSDITVSREWMHKVVKQHSPNPEVELPESMAGIAKKLLGG